MTGSLRDALEEQLVAERARVAARARRLAEAAALLDGLLDGFPDRRSTGPVAGTAVPADASDAVEVIGAAGLVDVLDLRARVHARCREYDAADACWARVQQCDPGHPGAVAGRRRIAAIRRRRSGTRPMVLDAMERERAAGAAGAAGATARAAALDRLAAGLAGNGVTVERRADAVRVVFAGGLFASGDRLTAAGGQQLVELGCRLRSTGAAVTVVGHVVAVPGGRTSGGSIVAHARALRAARQLADESGLPLTAFTLVSADQADGPFPDAARDRTVSLLVTPADPARPPR